MTRRADALAIIALSSGALLACARLSGMTVGGSGVGLPPFVAAAQETQVPPADDGQPLAADHNPPPVVNSIPRRPAKGGSSTTSDAKDKAKEKAKPKAKKAAPGKTKGGSGKPK
jgi:hypothetical protein